MIELKLPGCAALCEAVTPSGDTKAAYHGEFKFNVSLDGYDEDGEPLDGEKLVYVPWTTVKEIMAAIRERAALNTRTPSISGQEGEAKIKHMVNRFLMWRLPDDFHPDAGISFKPTFNDHMPTPTRHNPIGTNLFSADQAEAMVRYMLEGLSGVSGQEVVTERLVFHEAIKRGVDQDTADQIAQAVAAAMVSAVSLGDLQK